MLSGSRFRLLAFSTVCALLITACGIQVPGVGQPGSATPGAAAKGQQAPGKAGAQAKPGGRTVPVSVQPVQTGTISQIISYPGTIQPSQTVNVTPKVTGRVESVSADVGTQVTAGQVMAQIETAPLEIQVRNAEGGLQAARARLQSVLNGARSEDVAAAQANVRAAEARVQALNATTPDIVAAQSAVASAQAQLDRANADYARLVRPASSDDLAATQAQVEKTRQNLVKAQSDYDRVAWQGNIGARPEAVTLAQATADYQAAVSAYNLKVQPPQNEDVLSAQRAVESATAGLESAQAKLDQLQTGPKQADLDAAQAAVDQARSQLALRAAPFTQTDVEQQQAAVKQAQATLDNALLNVAEATIVAPFDGIVSVRSVNEGSIAATNQPMFTIVSSQVEVVVNVDESRIGLVRPGLPVTLTVSAYPNQRFAATVASIAPVGDSRAHTFPVKVVPTNDQGLLRGGMFAEVQLVADQKTNAVVVPREAVIQTGDKNTVFVVTPGEQAGRGTANAREVQLGISDDKQFEVVSGLQAGELIVIAGLLSVNDGDTVVYGGGLGGQQGGQPGQSAKPSGTPGASGGSGRPAGPPGGAAKPSGTPGAAAKPSGG